MDLCAYCGRRLPLLHRIVGSGRFCSRRHAELYQRELNQLTADALSRLRPSAPTPLPPPPPVVPDASPGCEETSRTTEEQVPAQAPFLLGISDPPVSNFALIRPSSADYFHPAAFPPALPSTPLPTAALSLLALPLRPRLPAPVSTSPTRPLPPRRRLFAPVLRHNSSFLLTPSPRPALAARPLALPPALGSAGPQCPAPARALPPALLPVPPHSARFALAPSFLPPRHPVALSCPPLPAAASTCLEPDPRFASPQLAVGLGALPRSAPFVHGPSFQPPRRLAALTCPALPAAASNRFGPAPPINGLQLPAGPGALPRSALFVPGPSFQPPRHLAALSCPPLLAAASTCLEPALRFASPQLPAIPGALPRSAPFVPGPCLLPPRRLAALTCPALPAAASTCLESAPLVPQAAPLWPSRRFRFRLAASIPPLSADEGTRIPTPLPLARPWRPHSEFETLTRRAARLPLQSISSSAPAPSMGPVLPAVSPAPRPAPPLRQLEPPPASLFVPKVLFLPVRPACSFGPLPSSRSSAPARPAGSVVPIRAAAPAGRILRPAAHLAISQLP